jgi:protein-L-isoaspartate(D-aspartate) O-methyltransferase
MVSIVRDWGLENEVVLEALGRVPRHEFVPVEYEPQAYANHPLPIGFGQTISQPYIVGLMTAELGVGPGAKVLEVGTGSGYQAAILAELGMQVYSIEIIEPLADRARADLTRVGYDGVQVLHADGYFGWEEYAPFDGILVTAAPDHVPQPIIQQLAIGATMVIPVGPAGGYQELWKITRVSADEVESVSLGGVRFVPLTRQDSP